MCERFPERADSDVAREGTASHWVASEVLVGRGAEPFTGRTAPNGVIITEEMVEGAKVYVEHVAARVLLPNMRHVEEKVAVKRVHPTECWGTPDCWFYDKAAGLLHVWDYKYGYGIVEPEDNWQLICYAAGVLDQVAPGGVADQHIRVVLHIVQPRAFHRMGAARSWTVTAADLRGHVNQLEAAAAQALGAAPQCRSGEGCKYCSARHACPAAQQLAMLIADYVGGATPEVLSPGALAIELRTLQRAAAAVSARLTGLEAQAIALLRAGTGVPGWGMEAGKGRQTWSQPAAEIFALGDLMGVDLRAPAAAVTPVQARKAGLPDALVAAYSTVPETGIKLVPVDKTVAARVFGI
jgi:hypothetical protein